MVNCAYCHESISTSANDVRSCPACQAMHHVRCWQDYGGCSTLGCRNNPSTSGFTAAQRLNDNITSQPVYPQKTVVTVPPLPRPRSRSSTAQIWVITMLLVGLVILVLLKKPDPEEPVRTVIVNQVVTATREATPPFDNISQPTTTDHPNPPPISVRAPTEAPAPSNEWIAFHTKRAGNYDIYLIHPDGSGMKPVIAGPGHEYSPAWSPDGEMIAYYSNEDGDFDIYYTDLSSGNTFRVTDNECDDYGPAWSPDGQKIAYYSICDGNREIYLIGFDGENRERLTNTREGIYNWFPTWSPDGKKITFASNISGQYQVFVMDSDGSAPLPIAQGCIPTFSPDGRQILFTSFCTKSGGVYLINSDGSNLRLLDDQHKVRNPAWSQDGTKIVFESDFSGNVDIWLLNLASMTWFQITNDSADDGVPVWQP